MRSQYCFRFLDIDYMQLKLFFKKGWWVIGVPGTLKDGRHYQKRLPFKGSIDERCFYDRRLSEGDVRMLYGAAKHQSSDAVFLYDSKCVCIRDGEC